MTKLVYNANLTLAKVFSVKFTKSDNLKKEKTDCRINTNPNPKAIWLAKPLSFLLTQSTSIPINLGKASAVTLVNNKNNNPR